MHYKVIAEQDYLRVEVSGREALQEAAGLLHAVTEEIREFGKKPILICSMHASPLTLVDLYVLARYVLKTALCDCKIAFLYDLDHVSELSRFIEAIGEGRGPKLAVFRTVSEAAEWLAGRQTPTGKDV